MRKSIYKNKEYRKAPIKKTILRKGDPVIVIAGSHKRQQGKIIKVFLNYSKVAIAGVNIRNVRIFDTSKKVDGRYKANIVQKECPIHISNVAYCHDGKPTKLGIMEKDGKKVRYIKKTGELIKP